MDLLQNKELLVPRAVGDLTIYQERFLGKEKCFLMSDEREKYLKLTANQYNFYQLVLKYFDGKHTVEEFDKVLREKSGGIYDAEKVISILYKNNLLEERSEENKTKVEIELSSKIILDIPLGKLQKKHERLISLFDALSQIIGGVAIIYALVLVIFNQDLIKEIYNQTKLFSWKNINPLDFVVIAVFALLSIPIHELGHLLSANRYHVKWKNFVFALKWGVNPIYYLRYQNFYSNRSRNKIIVLLSGVYFNIIQAAIYFILLVYTYDWKMAVLSIINLGSIVSCLFPSGTSDGYHIVSIIFDVEGIRWKMLKLIGSVVKQPRSVLSILKSRENIFLITYFLISYTLAIYGCYTLLRTVIEYLHIFSADKVYAILIISVWVGISVIINIFKFMKNLKNI